MIDRPAKRYSLKLYETLVGFKHIADYMRSEEVLIAESGKTLHGLVEDLLADVGRAYYDRTDLRLSRPAAKAEMTEFLTKQAPAEIGTEKVSEVSQRDGVKYITSDNSWL